MFRVLFAVALLALSASIPLSHAEEVSLSVTEFNAWLEQFKQRARKQNISDATLKEALAGIQPVNRIIELDRKQPEGTITFDEYLQRVIPASRVRKATRMYQQNKALLDEVGQKYGVQPRFIVALWGIESDFGARMGSFHVPEALATLAFEGRRGEFFEKELINALQIIEQGHIEPENMKGSWAGAMGQTQFMPSSFLSYAVDYDNDGHKDIWSSKPDAFASIANYLASVGWNDDETWGRKVSVPAGFDTSLADLKITLTMQEWNDLGVRRENGKPLPKVTGFNPSLILPNDKLENAHLVYDNFRAIMRWNRSTYFATAVGTLADAIH